MALEGGLNDRNREEMEIREQEEPALKNPASTLDLSPRVGGGGYGGGQRERRGSVNDILQRNQTLHTLLNSPPVSHNMTIFTGGHWHQTAGHRTDCTVETTAKNISG